MSNQIILSSELQNKISGKLEKLLVKTGAELIIFASNSGEILESRGKDFGDKIFSITALITGIYNTTQEIADILDENTFDEFFLKGKRWKLFYKKVTELFIVIFLFRNNAVLGPIKISSRGFTSDLESYLRGDKSSFEENEVEESAEDIRRVLDEFFEE